MLAVAYLFYNSFISVIVLCLFIPIYVILRKKEDYKKRISRKTIEFSEESVAIMIGITGQMKGQVLMAFGYEQALQVASKMMMGMPVAELDSMATSAISELGNMIMGNAATIFSTKGIVIDITPPTVCRGAMTITQSYAQNICVPIQSDDGLSLELDIAIKTD